MDIYLILLRIIHIFGGIFWVGATVINSVFLVPALRSSGPEGQKFMQSLMVHQRFPIAIAVSAWLTILAGVLLYWRDSGGLQISWITSSVGLGFTVGALAALVGFVLGALVLGPTARQLGELNGRFHASGEPPTAGQRAEITRLNARMGKAGGINMILLMVALLAMATARYWWF